MAGVSATGFEPATIDEIIADLQASWRQVLGDAVNIADQSRDGQMIAIFAEQLSEAWQAGEAIAQLFNPNGATGTGLDNLAALTGTTRLPASKSTVTMTLTGTATTVVNTGKIASVAGTTSKFATLAPATIAAVAAWAATTAYVAGDRRRNGGTQRVYQCITAGTSAGSGGPTTTAADITDGTVHWRFLGLGVAAIDVAAEATVTGPVQGYSGTITAIDTAVAGWAGVINLLDATPGNNVESDPDLRARRSNELGGQGVSALPALRAAILRVQGVTTCTVFENTTDATVDTLTPHSFECLVEGGLDASILQAIFDSKPLGIAPIGTTTGGVTDDAGVSHTMKFSRPTLVNVYVAIALTKDPAAYPTDGDVQCQEAIVNVGDQQRVGRDAIGDQIASWLYPRSDVQGVGVAGVLAVTSAKVDTANPPVTSNVTMTYRQKAIYDTSRITIVSTNGTP